MQLVSVPHALLGLLATGERHGYDLRRQYGRRFPAARPLAAAQVYATLERLQRDGLVRPGDAERGGGPERTPYTLTATGRTALRDWLREVVAPAEFVANPLAVKVTVALLLGERDTAQEFLRRQRAAHLARMRELTAAKVDPAATPSAVLAADFAVHHLDADLRWMETATARVARLAAEFRP